MAEARFVKEQELKNGSDQAGMQAHVWTSTYTALERPQFEDRAAKASMSARQSRGYGWLTQDMPTFPAQSI
jgi:hypothetical protein